MASKPDISFIVSTYKRPRELAVCLRSLELQQGATFEILVADNAGTNQGGHNGFQWFDTSKQCRDSYESANLLAEKARGRYLCFPSDDNYYVPVFAERMLRHAKRFKLDLVYCDFINDNRMVGSYEVIRAQPIIGHIDKGGFLIRNEVFPGFFAHRNDKDRVFLDGFMIERLRGTGIRFGKIHDVLWVHN